MFQRRLPLQSEKNKIDRPQEKKLKKEKMKEEYEKISGQEQICGGLPDGKRCTEESVSEGGGVKKELIGFSKYWGTRQFKDPM